MYDALFFCCLFADLREIERDRENERERENEKFEEEKKRSRKDNNSQKFEEMDVEKFFKPLSLQKLHKNDDDNYINHQKPIIEGLKNQESTSTCKTDRTKRKKKKKQETHALDEKKIINQKRGILKKVGT